MSHSRTALNAPRNRERAILCAYLRITGATQDEAAQAASVNRRTVQRWEGSPWWRDVQAEATTRWLVDLAARARRGLQNAVQGDGRLALQVLERLDARLAPPSLRVELAAALDYDELDEDELERIARGEDPRNVLLGRRSK